MRQGRNRHGQGKRLALERRELGGPFPFHNVIEPVVGTISNHALSGDTTYATFVGFEGGGDVGKADLSTQTYQA